MSRGTTDFNEARVGTAALEVCGACGLNTGTVLIKIEGDTEIEYTGPSRLRNRGARCEFCEFLELWMAHEGHDPQKDGKVGCLEDRGAPRGWDREAGGLCTLHRG